MPDPMKAVVLARFGGPEAFELRDVDVSGVIDEVGSDVTEFRPGDAVYYTPRIFGGPGSYAERHIADVDLVGRKPENIRLRPARTGHCRVIRELSCGR